MPHSNSDFTDVFVRIEIKHLLASVLKYIIKRVYVNVVFNICVFSSSAASSIVDCKLIFPHPSWYWDTLLKICVFIFAFIMPVLIITVCYGLMILRLKSVRMLSGSQVERNLLSCDKTSTRRIVFNIGCQRLN